MGPLRRLAKSAMGDPRTFKARGVLGEGNLQHGIASGFEVWFAFSGERPPLAPLCYQEGIRCGHEQG